MKGKPSQTGTDSQGDTAGGNFYAQNRLEALGETFLSKPVHCVMGTDRLIDIWYMTTKEKREHVRRIVDIPIQFIVQGRFTNICLPDDVFL